MDLVYAISQVGMLVVGTAMALSGESVPGVSPGAYISENSTHYFLPDWAYLGQESCQNTVNEYSSEHKIKAIFELSTLENTYLWILIFFIFYFFELSAQLGGQLAICRESWVVMYAPEFLIKDKNTCVLGAKIQQTIRCVFIVGPFVTVNSKAFHRTVVRGWKSFYPNLVDGAVARWTFFINFLSKLHAIRK